VNRVFLSFTGFEDPASEPEIGLGRGGIAAAVIVHQVVPFSSKSLSVKLAEITLV
jgi:hypothetical protein